MASDIIEQHDVSRRFDRSLEQIDYLLRKHLINKRGKELCLKKLHIIPRYFRERNMVSTRYAELHILIKEPEKLTQIQPSGKKKEKKAITTKISWPGHGIINKCATSQTPAYNTEWTSKEYKHSLFSLSGPEYLGLSWPTFM